LQQEPVIKNTSVKFELIRMENRKNLISNDFTYIWELADYFATNDN